MSALPMATWAALSPAEMLRNQVAFEALSSATSSVSPTYWPSSLSSCFWALLTTSSSLSFKAKTQDLILYFCGLAALLSEEELALLQ